MKIDIPDIGPFWKFKLATFGIMFVALMHDTGSFLASVVGGMCFVYFASAGIKWAATVESGNN